jgi:hypothetical protein
VRGPSQREGRPHRDCDGQPNCDARPDHEPLQKASRALDRSVTPREQTRAGVPLPRLAGSDRGRVA